MIVTITMNPLPVNRLFKTESYRRILQLQLLRQCSSKKSTRPGRGLGAVAAFVYRYMRERGTIGSDLLVLDNPADEKLVQKFEKAGVKKIVCTVKNEKHFQSIQEKLACSWPVYNYDLLAMLKRGTKRVSDAVEKENDILSSAGEVSGVVILASGVSDSDHLESHLCLVKRLMAMETFDGFQSLCKLDWFLALPGKQNLTHNFNAVRCLNSFYEHRDCLTIRYNDAGSIFHTDLVRRGPRKSSELGNELNFAKKISTFQGKDVRLIHFMPKFGVLDQMSLHEREAYKKFIHLISGQQRLIPALEKVFPGCGLGLIELGYGMADEIYQIPHDQFLQVYKDVKSLPEYEGSALHYLCSGKEMTRDVSEQDGNFNIQEPHEEKG